MRRVFYFWIERGFATTAGPVETPPLLASDGTARLGAS